MWTFIQNQILGMKWLNALIGRLLTAAGLDVNTRIGGSVQFFLYDVIKITVLLCVLIFLISYIQSFFPPERSRKIMGRFHGIGANIVGALLGTVTPFCSCSSIPIFMGFTSAGLPLGVTFSFLISSPMVDLGSLVLLMSIFGTKIAILYVVMGLVIAVIGGTVIEKLHMEDQIADFIRNSQSSVDIEAPDLTAQDRAVYAKEQVVSTFKKVFPYILIGVGIGAIIHNWIPESWIQTILGSSNPFGVILATVIGVPMYADIFGTIPVAEALLAKGALLGTILSFMMAVAFMYVVYNVFIAFTRPEAADFASRYYSFALLLLFLLLWYAIDRLSRYVNVGTSVNTVLPLLFLVLAVSVGVFTQRRNLVEYTYLQDHNAISALKQYDTLDTILYESSTHVSYECVSLRPWNTALSPVNSTDSTPPEALPDQFLFWTGLDNTENQVMHELLQRGYSVEHLCDTHISSVYHCHNA